MGRKGVEMRVLTIIGLLSLLSIAAYPQEAVNLRGRVTNKDGTVAAATIQVVSTTNKAKTYTTKTNDRGEYNLTGFPAGMYEVSASVDTGDSKQVSPTVTVRILYEGTTEVDLELAQVGGIRETVTVSASRSQTVEQVSKTVDVITGQEMRDRADFALVESLRTIPGFRVQQSGGFGRLATIKTRGLRNQDTAILVDGIRFRDVSAITGDASPFLSDFTLTSVSQIEVLRGSGSSLYGTNAIGGTIDFQTPEAREGTHGQIGGAFGGLGLRRFRGNLSHGIKNGKFGIGAGLSRTEYTKGIDGEDDAGNTNFQTRFDADPSSRTSLSGRVFFSRANVRLNTGPDTFGTLPTANTTIINALSNVNFTPDVNDPDSFQRSRFFSGQFAASHVINSRLVLGGYYQGLTTKRTNDNGALGAGFQSASTSIFDGSVHTGNAYVNWTPNRIHEIKAGYEIEVERFENDGSTPSGTEDFFTRAGQKSRTLYIQDLVSLLGGRLQLAGGARAQRFTLTRPEFSLANAPYSSLTLSDPPTAFTFDGSASYFVKRSGTKLRAHVGNGYRVPSLYERFGTFFSTFGTPQFVALGDPFLKPEKTIAFDAGIEQNVANDRVRLSGTYFYTKLTDIIGFGNSVPNIGNTARPFGGYENQTGGIARGGEFSARVKAARSTDVFTSYTYTNSDQGSPQVAGSGISRTLGVPDHQFTLVATHRFKRAWVNFDFLATSTYLAPIFSNSVFTTYIYRFEGNRKGDLTGGYTFGFRNEKLTLRVYGTIENVFGQTYFENGFRTAARTERVGLSFGF